jgi:hypothetical protein
MDPIQMILLGVGVLLAIYGGTRVVMKYSKKSKDKKK